MFDSLLHPADRTGLGLAFTDRLDGTQDADTGFAGFNLGRAEVVGAAGLGPKLTALADAIGVGELVVLSQVHGTDVAVVDEQSLAALATHITDGAARLPSPLGVADAAITDLAGVALVIRVADCVPVLLADAKGRWIGAAHAGRDGMLNGVLTATVEALREHGAGDLTAWIGPHICGHCYELPAEMVESARGVRPAAPATTSWGTPSLDLGAGCAAELDGLGVRVERLDPCTMESDQFYSHRRQHGQAGRQAGVIWRDSRMARLAQA